MTNNPQAPKKSVTMSAQWDKNAFRYIGALAIALLALGTVVYHIIEDWSWVDSFYFSSVALTTVGFGDLSPSSDVSKLFTVFYLFVGIALIGGVLSAILKVHAAKAAKRLKTD